MTAAALWARLSADGLVEGEMPAPERPASPWYVRVMLGIAGWIGALFLLGFVAAALAFLMDDSTSALVTGAVCCGCAYALFRGFDGNDFGDQFALAVSLAGQGMMITGLIGSFDSQGPGALPRHRRHAGRAGVSRAQFPPPPARLLRRRGRGGAGDQRGGAARIVGAVPVPGAGPGVAGAEDLGGRRRTVAPGRLRAGAGAVAGRDVSPVRRRHPVRSRASDSSWIAIHGPLIGRALTAAVLLFVAVALIRREAPNPRSPVALGAGAGALVLGLVSLAAPGLASALLILLLGFAAGNRLMAALGILSLLGFVSHFYYSLHATLLEKSGILAATGLCLLAAWFALRRAAPVPAATDSGHA